MSIRRATYFGFTWNVLLFSMRTFDIPKRYSSPVIGRLKAMRSAEDPRKQDVTPAVMDFGGVEWVIPRHFGFCFGVENAIEIVHQAIAAHPDKRIFLLSQMIHNPVVNDDLEAQGVQFLHDTEGKELTPFSVLTSEDVVIIPAFGTTVKMEDRLRGIGLDIEKYNTTCPFVERVWKRSAKLGAGDFTVVIHGKPGHEETRATFSHACATGHALVVCDREEAEVLAEFISGRRELGGDPAAGIKSFDALFGERTSKGFSAAIHLQRIGVVNQTTMLATETQAIADLLKTAVEARESMGSFSSARDTLCYATVDNQKATLAALEHADKVGADLALVVGGFNSSNTSHLVELCEERLPTYFISGAEALADDGSIDHFELASSTLGNSNGVLVPRADGSKLRIVLTSGASCPDASVDAVLQRVNALCDGGRDVDEVLSEIEPIHPVEPKLRS